MRYLRFILLAICATLFESTFICAQESNDYYKFDDRGVLVEFLHTTPDGVKISYAYHNYAYGPIDEMGLITYPDGTQVDYSRSISCFDDGYPFIWVDQNYDKSTVSIKDWYKDLRKAESAPTGAAMCDGMFGLREYQITFPDNSQWGRGHFDHVYVDASENGD